MMKKVLMKTVAIVAAMTVAFALFTACGEIKSVAAEPVTYVAVKINPEAEFTVGEDGKVLSVEALNADAEILLSDMDLLGIPVEEAIEQFTAAAAETGYIDVDGSEQKNDVKITVISQDGENEEEVREKIAEKVRKYFRNNGINGKVSDATLELYAQEAEKWDISTGKMKMVLRALDLDPEASAEELAAMPVKKLIKLINSKHTENMTFSIRKEFKAEREELREDFAEMFTLGEEIGHLKEQLTGFAGTDEEKVALEIELAEKTARFEAQRTLYREKLAEIDAEAKAKCGEIKEQRQAEKQQRKEEYKERNEKHKEKTNGKK